VSHFPSSCWIVLFPLLIRVSILLRGQNLPFRIYWATCCQELFFSYCLLLLFFVHSSALILIAAAQSYIFVDAMLYSRLKIRMAGEHVKFIKELPHLWSSLKELGVVSFISGLLLIFTVDSALFYFSSPPPAFSLWMWPPLIFLLIGFAVRPKMAMHPFLLLKRKSKRQYVPVKEESTIFKSTETPHVIIVLMESFRSRDIGEEHSPHFCALMKEGIYFPNFYANGVKSSHAAVATLQGLPPFLRNGGYHSAYLHNGFLSFEGQRELLQYLGFQTLIGRNELLSHFPQAKGNSWGILDEYLMEYAASYLQSQRYPTFMTLATMTNHHPWILPSSQGMKAHKRERFLQTFRYSDAALGRFIQLLKDKDLYDKSFILILGDHGQPMGEHRDNFLVPNGLYEENVHIPLLILGGKKLSPQVRDCVGSQVDILPTLKDLLGAGSSPESLLQSDTPNRAAFFQSSFGEGYLGCREGNYKYIFSCGEEELFDLAKDPDEKNNIAKEHPDKTRYFFNAVHSHSFSGLPTQLTYDEAHLIHHVMATDEELEKMILEKPEVQIAHLNDSLLLTDRSVGRLFQNCPHLEHVNLSGTIDITDLAWANFKGPNLKMARIDMLDCPRITTQGLTSLFNFCPHLHTLSICCANVTHFPDLSLSQLESLHIQQGHHLTDRDLFLFVERHARLEQLVLEECMHLTDESLKAVKGLKRLRLFSCPSVTDEGLLELKSSNLVLLEIYNCPQISPTILKELSNHLHLLS
jgi:hypothetical protein